ncbi:MAG: thiolase family protein [Candidatus Hodarchaeales archaeon]|jgi:acetyl-CoA C-acetyltransferase/acetyl-CoA acyltransferase
MKELKECVVVDAVRTPIGKSGRAQMKKLGGSFRECSAQDLLVAVLKSVVERTEKKYPDFDPKEIEDLQVGCLSQLGEQGGNIARIAIMLMLVFKRLTLLQMQFELEMVIYVLQQELNQ